MEYFAEVKTIQGATKRYRALAKKWHPDRNGSVEAGAVMAEINRQYRVRLVELQSDSQESGNINFSQASKKTPETHVTGNCDDQAGGQVSGNEAPDGVLRPSNAKFGVKSFVNEFVSDSDIERLGDAAENMISNATKAMLHKGIAAFKRWKSAG